MPIQELLGSSETGGPQTACIPGSYSVLYVQEVVTQPKILNRTILSNIIHVT